MGSVVNTGSKQVITVSDCKTCWVVCLHVCMSTGFCDGQGQEGRGKAGKREREKHYLLPDFDS